MGLNDINSLSHTKWNCKYQIVFAPKYRRKVFYSQKKREIGKILRQLCEWKGVKILEAEVCPDHIHMLVEIPPKMAVSSFMGYFNGCGDTTFVMIQGIIGGICVRLPISWAMSQITPVSLFRIGLATPISSAVQITLCVMFFVFVQRVRQRNRNFIK